MPRELSPAGEAFIFGEEGCRLLAYDDAHRLRWRIMHISESETPKRFANSVFPAPLARIFRTVSALSFLLGWLSPRRFTNPVSHCSCVFLDKDIHSRFSTQLFSLLPSMWLIVQATVGLVFGIKANPTSRWTRNFLREFPFLTCKYLYPLDPTCVDRFCAGRFCEHGWPFLHPYVIRSSMRTFPILETHISPGQISLLRHSSCISNFTVWSHV